MRRQARFVYKRERETFVGNISLFFEKECMHDGANVDDDEGNSDVKW